MQKKEDFDISLSKQNEFVRSNLRTQRTNKMSLKSKSDSR